MAYHRSRTLAEPCILLIDFGVSARESEQGRFSIAAAQEISARIGCTFLVVSKH